MGGEQKSLHKCPFFARIFLTNFKTFQTPPRHPEQCMYVHQFLSIECYGTLPSLINAYLYAWKIIKNRHQHLTLHALFMLESPYLTNRCIRNLCFSKINLSEKFPIVGKSQPVANIKKCTQVFQCF